MKNLKLTNYRSYNQVTAAIEANGQTPLETSGDARLESIWQTLIDYGCPVKYATKSSIAELDLANKSDDEILYNNCQNRSKSRSVGERTKDDAVIERALTILEEGENWHDFQNPPVGFLHDNKFWFLVGNGRLGSLLLAEQYSSQKIPFSYLEVDISSFKDDVSLHDFCFEVSRTSNQKTGHEVEEESREIIKQDLSDYCKRIEKMVEQNITPPSSYFKEGVDLWISCKEAGDSPKKCRSIVANFFLRKHKNIKAEITIGKLQSETFDDYRDASGRPYKSNKTFEVHVNSLLDNLIPWQSNAILTSEPGWHENPKVKGGKSFNYITTGLSPRNVKLPILEHSMAGKSHNVTVVHDPFTNPTSGNIQIKTRESSIYRSLQAFSELNQCDLITKGGGDTVVCLVFPRMIDNTAMDKSGNHDCDIVYWWTGNSWKRLDNGQFLRKNKLKTEVSLSEDEESEE